MNHASIPSPSLAGCGVPAGQRSVRPLDLVIPIYRNAGLVAACVDSVRAAIAEVTDRATRLVLINDSPDDSAVCTLLAAYAAQQPQTMVLHNASNLGFVATANRGLQQALLQQHDVLLINSDTVTFPDTLRWLLSAAAADPQIGFASPRSNNASLCSLPHASAGGAEDPAAAHARWQALSRWLPDWHYSPTAVGFYLYIEHSVLANHGLLSSAFGTGYEEENDLIMRAGKVGRRSIIVNRAFAYHVGSASFDLQQGDVAAQRLSHWHQLAALHPEFPVLVQRYEHGAHFRAERLLGAMLADQQGRLSLLLDLSSLGTHHNGTSEHTLAVVRSLSRRWQHRFAINAAMSEASWDFHDLGSLPGLRRVDPAAPGLHALGLRLSQPFERDHLTLISQAAAVNVFAMLDTIAEDCGPLNAERDFLPLWAHVAAHANGLLFSSRTAAHAFALRHGGDGLPPCLVHLLSTRLADYTPPPADGLAQSTNGHVLVIGNHFPHKGAEPVARLLAEHFPALQFVLIGGADFQQGNLTSHRSGHISLAAMDGHFATASTIVLPSHMEGFGLGLMHALARRKPVVARRIPATEEILGTLDHLQGVVLFDTEQDVVAALRVALTHQSSGADDQRAHSWDDWSDAVAEFLLARAAEPTVFAQARRRLAALSTLLQASGGAAAAAVVQAPAGIDATRDSGADALHAAVAAATALSAPQLLALQGMHFVEQAYLRILHRHADPSGARFYAGLLQQGMTKSDLLRALASSPEGQLAGGAVDGLLETGMPSTPAPRARWLARLLRTRLPRPNA